jgi:hypothetical protein
LAGLEILASGCLTFLLASAGNDPDLSKAKAILSTLKAEGSDGLRDLPEYIQAEARTYLTTLINQILQNLVALRGGPSVVQ